MKLRPGIFSLAFISCCLTWCATPGGTLKLAPDSKVISTETGNDGRDSFCSGFNLTGGQAKAFLRNATIVSFQELHYKYDWLSCYVRGTLTDGTGTHQWEIRAGGTGSMKYASGEVIYLVCPECDDRFK